MKTITTLSFATLAIGAALALAPALHAQETPKAVNPPATTDHGMMGGDMKGMMNMMGEMNKMMENCNRMMQTKDDRQNKEPAKKDGRG